MLTLDNLRKKISGEGAGNIKESPSILGERKKRKKRKSAEDSYPQSVYNRRIHDEDEYGVYDKEGNPVRKKRGKKGEEVAKMNPKLGSSRESGGTNESVGKTPGDRSYYNLQKAKELAKKAGHDYDKLPQYDRRHNDHKDYFDNKAKNENVNKAARVARSYMMKKPNPVNITRAGINKAGRDALKKATTSYDKHNKNDVLAKHGFKRPTSEAVNPHDDEGANHIVMQLRKAVTLRGMRPVEFKDGKKVRVEVGHAQKFLSKYNQAKPADKEKMQAKAQKSHGHFKSTISEELELNEDPSKSLKAKSEKSRIPVGLLRSVYNRGMAAWKGGHRKGMAQQQWAHARVNSFISKGSGTWGKADKDLADKARAAMKSKKNESVNEDRMAGKYRKGQTIVRGQWPNPDKWAEEYIMPNADKKGVRIYSTGPAFVIEKL